MQRERASDSNFADDGYAAAHRLRQALGNGQSQSRAVNLFCYGRPAAIKRLKNLMQFRAVNALPPILHADPNLVMFSPSFNAGANPDPAALVAVLQSVGHQVLQALRQS